MSYNNEETPLSKFKKFLIENGKYNIEKGTTLNLLKMNSTKRKNYIINNYSYSESNIDLPESDLFELKKNRVLYKNDYIERTLTLTLKGIILLEYELDQNNEKIFDFLDDLNDSYFEKLIQKGNEPLEAQEKGIIIVLLGLHAFSSVTALKLSQSTVLNEIKTYIDKSLNFLISLGDQYKDSSIDKIWELNVVGEDPVAARINRLNNISVKTNQIYTKDGGKHFLNVLNDNKLDSKKIEFLLRKIFDKGSPSYEKRNEFISLLKFLENNRYKVNNLDEKLNDGEIRNELYHIIKKFTSE